MKEKRRLSCYRITYYLLEKVRVTATSIKISLTVLAGSVVFHQVFVGVLKTVMVEPLFSTIGDATVLTEWIVLVAAVLSFFIYLLGVFIDRRLSTAENALWITVGLLYISFRLGWYTDFQFVRFTRLLSHHVALLDILLVPATGIGVNQVARWFRRAKTAPSSEGGLYYDQPRTLSGTQDHFERMSHVELLAAKMKATSGSDQSFAIGIVGKWGSGKTTFMNTLREKLKGDAAIVQLTFNPWRHATSGRFARDFLMTLAREVAMFDRNAGKTILAYAREVVESIDDKGLAIVKSVLKLSEAKEEPETQFEEINRSLDKIGKKFIVYVDDLDRLDKIEILEVLRIIRNTANFRNVFFVAAYDKVYLSESIQQALAGESHRYLEKIFQLEFYLPVYPAFGVIYTYLDGQLAQILTPRDWTVWQEIRTRKRVPPDEFSVPLGTYLINFRDVARYLNLIVTSYDLIKENVYLPDFFAINLLRLKFPEVYSLLYLSKLRFLGTAPYVQFFDYESKQLVLKLDETKENRYQNTNLYKYLRERIAKMALSPEDLELSVQLVEDIFPPASMISARIKRRTSPGANLSIVEWGCFERYFDFLMTDRLPEQVFREVMQQDLQTIKSAFEEWSGQLQMGEDLQNKLSHYAEIATWADFEKFILGIVFFADLPAPGRPSTYGFDPEVFYDRYYSGYKAMFMMDSNSIKRARDLYLQLFREGTGRHKWGYIHSVTDFLIRKGYDQAFFFAQAELVGLMVYSLMQTLDEVTHVTNDINGFYGQVYVFLHQPELRSTSNQIEKLRAKMIALVERDMATFLSIIMYRDSMSAVVQVNVIPMQVYRSPEEFVVALERLSADPAVYEFLEYYKEALKGQWRNMHFKHFSV